MHLVVVARWGIGCGLSCSAEEVQMRVRMLCGWSALSLRSMLPLLEEPTANG